MTSVSKKINKLVSTSENDLTEELEIPDFDSAEFEIDDPESEAAAETCEFPQAEFQAEADEPSGGTLAPGTNSRADSIDRLQSDIEQLRAEWAGLEQEIGKSFNDELEQLNEKLQSSERELGERQRELDNVRQELDEAEQSAKQSSAEIKQLKKTAKTDQATVRNLEKQFAAGEKKIASIELKLEESRSSELEERKKGASQERQLTELEKQLGDSRSSFADLEKHLDEQQDAWTQLQDEFAQVRTSLENSGNEIVELSRLVENGDADRERKQSRIDELSEQLATQVANYNELESDNRELRRATRNDVATEIERSHKVIAEQAGLLAGNEQEISELSAQISRTERYADDLRQQLQDQSEIAGSAFDRRQDLEAACTAAEEKVSGLSEELTSTRQQNAAFATKIGKLEKGFAKEVRQIRFELGEAENTIADQDTINVQLTSDLFNNKGFQQILETQLRESEEQNEQTIQQLEQEANKLRNQVEDYEYKLDNKDEAIAALMAELAGRNQTTESIDEIENAVHELEDVIDDIDERIPELDDRIPELDDRIPELTDVQEHGERERVTRLLIGKTEGQELRFPLFKDRLTIGRTAHNDIQLNTQFISRQHAVIVTEDGSTKIVDWGSKNGVLVNQKRVAEQILKNGDIVTIGTTEFLYEERPKR